MKNGEQPAMPLTVDRDIPNIDVSHGLTKREIFAIAAMQGLLSRYYAVENPLPLSDVAFAAVEAADELLKALEK